MTSHLQADYAAGSQHYGFLIRDATENNNGAEQAFRPRGSGSNRPQLIIRYTSAGSGQQTASATGPGEEVSDSWLADVLERLAARPSDRPFTIHLPLLRQ